MNELEIGGHTYRIGRLSALTQFHCARRIAPALAAVGAGFGEVSEAAKETSADNVLFAVMEKVAEVMSKMTDVDVDYVIHTCLGVVTRRQEDMRWASITRGTRMLFEDIDMPTMIQITIAVLKENLGDFFPMVPGGTNTPNASGAVDQQSN